MYDPNKELIRQLVLQIKSMGYVIEKDDLGYYFTLGDNKFSLMYCGPLFHCYFNQQSGGAWSLKTKKMNFATMLDALVWIIQTMNESKKQIVPNKGVNKILS